MSAFQAKRVICSHEEEIKAPSDEIFPLLCPVKELDWIDGWQYEMVYTESGVNENNCIFREDSSGAILFSSPVTTTWITTLHDPENSRVQFVLVPGELAVIKLDVELKDSGNGISSARLQFTFTPLSEDAIDETTEGKLLTILTFLAKSLKHYCETGEMLRTRP